MKNPNEEEKRLNDYLDRVAKETEKLLKKRTALGAIKELIVNAARLSITLFVLSALIALALRFGVFVYNLF